MATQTQQWIPLDEVVAAYIDRSEQSPNKYMKLWNIAYDGMQECGLDAFYSVKSILLPINANMTANLPEDYLQYTKVGSLNSNGEVTTLQRNDNISRLKPFHTDRQSDEVAAALDPNSDTFYNYWQGDRCGNICGIQGSSAGFTMSESEGLLFLNGISADHLVLEYLASPNPDTDYKVPVQFREALIAFIAWKDLQYVPGSRRGNITDKAQRRKDFYNERRLAIARFKPFRLTEAYKAW